MGYFSDLQGKLQKHQAFDAEVVANKDRIFSTISMGQGMHCSSLVLIPYIIRCSSLTLILVLSDVTSVIALLTMCMQGGYGTYYRYTIYILYFYV